MRDLLKSLREYIREAVAAVTAFLGGAVIFIAGLVLDLAGYSLPKPYMTAGGILLMISGQFWAYHKKRLAHLADTKKAEDRITALEDEVRKLRDSRPDVDERLELVKVTPGFAPLPSKFHQSFQEAQRELGYPTTPDSEHQIEVIVATRVEIDPPAIQVGSSGDQAPHERLLALKNALGGEHFREVGDEAEKVLDLGFDLSGFDVRKLVKA